MPELNSPVEILKQLDKSNCGECGEKTCLAFASAVFRGKRRLAECPRLDPEIAARFVEQTSSVNDVAENRQEALDQLKKKVSEMDLPSLAEQIGGRFSDGKLTLKILGKDFSVDAAGNLYAQIHINPWVAAPFLDYIIRGKGILPTGNWVSFRELKGGRAQYPLFIKRCEEPMKQVADDSTDLFDDMVHVFDGKQVARQFQSDVSVVLNFLPRVPVMICYWSPEDGMDSSLHVFFDETADQNLSIGSLFSLGAGFAQMLQKVALRHM